MTSTSLITRIGLQHPEAAGLPSSDANPEPQHSGDFATDSDRDALGDLSTYQPTSTTNPLGWDLKPVHITCYGPDQSGLLRQYAADPRSNTNPPLVGLAGLLLGVDIVPAGSDQPHGGRLYLAIDLQGQLPERINQLRLRIGTAAMDRNWPVRTALYGLLAGEFGPGSEVGITTHSGQSIYFVDVLRASGRAVIPARGYWGSPEAIGYTPLDILLAVNNLRRRLDQDDLGPEVFGDLLDPTDTNAVEAVPLAT
jgi:hypothetical protein